MKPKHHKAQYFLSKGLFSGLKNFNEFETRMVSLTDHERGQAFEVFAEAYFATCALFQAEEVWPDKIMPQSIRSLLGLSPIDMGIDGVFKALDGNYHAYQVKYRTGRTTLSWDELSTFMGLSDKAHMRLLLTNSQDIASVMNSRTDFYSVKGNDLDRLEESDFRKIEEWLRTGAVLLEKKLPFPHQAEAITNILNELATSDRATAIMACGTGKTLVALWVAEKIEAQTILVLLPSLALVRQTLHDWAKESRWNRFNYLCVCSDATVAKGNDEVVLHQQDLDFPVTTTKEVVKRFLQNSQLGPKIVFSTYQSSSIVAEAMPQGFSFDIGIFDEAHKTASRQGANYSFALQDKNIHIKKRLFLTATPRHFNVNKKGKEGEKQIVFSMDDKSIYGKVAHNLSFRAAVKKDLICDYKIIISVITSEELTRELLKRGEVIVEGDVIKAQRMANIIALQKTVEEYDIKRIFSFHSSVSAAKSFTSEGSEGVGSHITDFLALHVNGEMTTNKREMILKEFEESPKAIISNARCLTEGVNIPAVDMVAFVSPKKSKVDIVQAAGRAMRKHKNKQIGYILIPLFLQVDVNESIDESLEKTQFESIWDVLQAMQEQDESLVEIIAQLREERGKALGYNDNRLRERIEILGPELSLVELRKAITTQIMKTLGSDWDERFGELLKFKEMNGHCNVPQYYPANRSLGMWVGTQRHLHNSKNRRLNSTRINKLNEIGFVWMRHDSLWEVNFRKLCDFKKQNGHCFVPKRYVLDNTFGRWVIMQRTLYKNGKISKERIDRLEDIGFIWDLNDLAWRDMLSQLVLFSRINGHCRATVSNSQNPTLVSWLITQRAEYKNGRLTAERMQLLNQVGMDWNPIDSAWEKMFSELYEFKRLNGHCLAPQNVDGKKSSLGLWVATQRVKYKQGQISKEQIAKLNTLGFDWDPISTSWEKNYLELCKFMKINGHCSIPAKYPENQILATWVHVQRRAYKKEILSQEQIRKLEQVGFIWDYLNKAWEDNFLILKNYYQHNGHCNIPANYPDNQLLATWVNTQRYSYKKNTISTERIEKLNSLGFNWDFLEKEWDDNFMQLSKFKEINGHCNVPKRYGSLGRWVMTQRKSFKDDKLLKTRVDKLNQLGFIWSRGEQ